MRQRVLIDGRRSRSGGSFRGLVGQWDWPSYGHDAQHTFHGRTTLTPSSVRSLRQAWFFPTGDAVTATPTVVDGTVYVGSWDDYFYAVNLRTGSLRWKVRLASQNAITPYPGQHPRDVTSDGGLVTSSAWFEPASGSRPALVIFGGGYTLYALNAATGAVYWRHDYPGLPGPPNPKIDSTRIFSSPVVADGRVLFGVDEDGQSKSAGYVVAASLDTGDPVPGVPDRRRGQRARARRQLRECLVLRLRAARPRARGLRDGRLQFLGSARYADAVMALHIGSGTLAWLFHPLGHSPACDDDFGASANVGVTASGKTSFLGVGSKDGTYYSLNPATGRQRWATNVVFGGSSGGFIGGTAYDGRQVYGATGHRRLPPNQERRGADGLRPVRSGGHRDAEPHGPCLRRCDGFGQLAGQRGRVLLTDHGGRGDGVQRARARSRCRAGA